MRCCMVCLPRRCASTVRHGYSQHTRADIAFRLPLDLPWCVNAIVKVMDKYRSGEVRLLVATDVAARGLDVKDISYVINYDFPVDGVEVSSPSYCNSSLVVWRCAAPSPHITNTVERASVMTLWCSRRVKNARFLVAKNYCGTRYRYLLATHGA